MVTNPDDAQNKRLLSQEMNKLQKELDEASGKGDKAQIEICSCRLKDFYKKIAEGSG